MTYLSQNCGHTGPHQPRQTTSKNFGRTPFLRRGKRRSTSSLGQRHHLWLGWRRAGCGYRSGRCPNFWVVRPAGQSWPLPRGSPTATLDRAARPLQMYTLAAQGVAVLSMDCRGQDGDTPDMPPLDGGHHAGWLTRGLTDPHHYYYRYVFTDAVRAIDALVSREEVDQGRVGVTGGSQGGGLALAAAGFSVALVLCGQMLRSYATVVARWNSRLSPPIRRSPPFCVGIRTFKSWLSRPWNTSTVPTTPPGWLALRR